MHQPNTVSSLCLILKSIYFYIVWGGQSCLQSELSYHSVHQRYVWWGSSSIKFMSYFLLYFWCSHADFTIWEGCVGLQQIVWFLQDSLRECTFIESEAIFQRLLLFHCSTIGTVDVDRNNILVLQFSLHHHGQISELFQNARIIMS